MIQNWLNFKFTLSCPASAEQVQQQLKSITKRGIASGLGLFTKKSSTDATHRYEGSIDSNYFFLVSTRDTELNGQTYEKNSAVHLVGEIVPGPTGCDIQARVPLWSGGFFVAIGIPLLIVYSLVSMAIENSYTGGLLIFLGAIVVMFLSIPAYLLSRRWEGMKREREFLEAFLGATYEPEPVVPVIMD